MAPEGYLFGRLFCVALTKGTESGRLKYFWTDLIDDSTDGDFLPDTSFDMVIFRVSRKEVGVTHKV